MAGFSTGSYLLVRAALVLSLAAGGVVVMPAPVQAQGLFDLLGSIFRGPPPHTYRPEPPHPLDGFPHDDYYEELPRASGGPRIAYCVRLCDGRFFPLSANAGAPSSNPAQLCSKMCPSAQTEVFYGSKIDHAVTQRGRRYTEIENAFLFRDQLVSNCSCTGTDTTGVARVAVEEDPTLRPGDIVITAEGPKVFTGNRRMPHQTGNFVPVDRAKGMPRSVRQQISEMRIAPEYGPANVKSGQSAPAVSIGTVANPALSLAQDEEASETPDPN